MAVWNGRPWGGIHSAVASASPWPKAWAMVIRIRPVNELMRAASNQHSVEAPSMLNRPSIASWNSLLQTSSSLRPRARRFGRALRRYWLPTMESLCVSTAPRTIPWLFMASAARRSASSLSWEIMSAGEMMRGCQLSSSRDMRLAPSRPPPIA
ncbi:hypothetical protein phiA034_gene0079 [Aeromonas phage phiA034]|uniref:Uncharacterized protein n=1 Tax=Aeromonas phage phiA034 TaxID=2985287 RepID=A0AAF0C137_9CAUD|nr:hypothetical protein phiA034_gene0079 [Aeromonas phage phiA034]